MYSYRVESPSGTYQIIEADYFDVTKDDIGNRDALFYVTRRDTEPGRTILDTKGMVGGNINKEVLVAYVKNPTLVTLSDNVRPVKPSFHDHGHGSLNWPPQITNCRSFGSDPGDYTLDTAA